MAIMSDEGEKTCPLCTEEMDLTDQQLKPCKCGYEICVWCWHRIMDMAEKDETEGRCPACRTPYNKEKIVGTTANCARGTRAANNLPLHTSTQCSNEALKKQDVSDGPVACSTAAVNQRQLSSLHSDNTAKILVTDKDSIVSQDKSEVEALGPVVESNTDETAIFSTTKLPAISTNDVNSSSVSGGLASGRSSTDATDGKMEKMPCSHFMPTSIHENQSLDDYVQVIRGMATSQTSETTANTSGEMDSRDAQSDLRLGTPSPVTQIDLCDIEDDLMSFENQRLKDPEVAPNRNNFSHASHLSSHFDVNSNQHSKADASIGSHLDRQVADKICNSPVGHSENILKTPEVNNAEYSNFFPAKEKRSQLGRYDGELCTDAFDIGESSIISKILSIDPWDESLTSPQNLAKLLGENDKQRGSFGVPGSWKNHSSNQSRFSFAREEEPRSQASGFGQSVDYFTKGSNQSTFGHEFSNSNSFQLEKLDSCNGFPVFNGMESEFLTGNHSHMPSNRLSVSRPQVSAPPGFSVPSRTPPPGFTSHDRTDQFFNGSGNHLLDGDIEFIDPAILAVGKGLLPDSVNNSGVDLRAHYSSQLSTYEDAKFQSILQSSLPSHQNEDDLSDQLQSKLQDCWPSLRGGDPVAFWLRQYNKHGLLSGLGVRGYFACTVKLYEQLTEGLRLTLNKRMKVGKLLKQLQKHMGVIPWIRCMRSDHVEGLSHLPPIQVLFGIQVRVKPDCVTFIRNSNPEYSKSKEEDPKRVKEKEGTLKCQDSVMIPHQTR